MTGQLSVKLHNDIFSVNESQMMEQIVKYLIPACPEVTSSGTVQLYITHQTFPMS